MQKNKNFLQNLLTLTDFVDIIDKSVAWTGIEVVITGLTRNPLGYTVTVPQQMA